METKISLKEKTEASATTTPEKKESLKLKPVEVQTEEHPQINIAKKENKLQVFTLVPMDKNILTTIAGCSINQTLLDMSDDEKKEMIKKRKKQFEHQSVINVMMNFLNANPALKEFIVLARLDKQSNDFMHESFSSFGINISRSALNQVCDATLMEYHKLTTSPKDSLPPLPKIR